MKYKIIVDKQSRLNPTSEKKEYEVDIEELRYKGDIADELIFTNTETYVIRRLSLSEYHVLSVLQEPIKEPLPNINIELFEGENFIYVYDMIGNKLRASYLIKNDFTNNFVTVNLMNSTIEETAQRIALSVAQTLQGYTTTEQVQGLIEVLATQITIELSKKVNGEDYTSAQILLKINNDTSEAKIKADKLSLEGLVTIENLKTSGKTIINGSNITTGTIDASKAVITNINASNIKSGEIDASKITVKNIDASKITTGTLSASKIKGGSLDLTGTNTTISSTNFSVDKNGNVTANLAKLKNVTITNGSIELQAGENDTAIFRIYDPDTAGTIDGNEFWVYPYGLTLGCFNKSFSIDFPDGGTSPIVKLSGRNYKQTLISADKIETPILSQTSLKARKKNIKKLKVNALELIKEADICEYNFKKEKAGTKKHIGLVIGEGYNCPEQVISEEGQSVEQYSLTSLLWKAVQELTVKVEKLELEVA